MYKTWVQNKSYAISIKFIKCRRKFATLLKMHLYIQGQPNKSICSAQSYDNLAKITDLFLNMNMKEMIDILLQF